MSSNAGQFGTDAAVVGTDGAERNGGGVAAIGKDGVGRNGGEAGAVGRGGAGRNGGGTAAVGKSVAGSTGEGAAKSRKLRRPMGSRHFARFVLLLLLAAGAAALWSRGAAVEWLFFGAAAAVSVWCLVVPYLMVGRMEAVRLLEAPKALADGDELRIRLVVSVARPLPLCWLAVSESIVNETAYGKPVLFCKRVLVPGFRRTQTIIYTVKGLQRGELSYRPLQVMVGDLLGLTVRSFEIECPGHTLVLPKPPEVSMGKWLPGEKSAGDRRAAASVEPISSGKAAAGRSGAGLDMRVYAPGDPLRLVNWRAMARGLGMQTRLNEWAAPCGAIILLDASGEAYCGDQRLFDACVGRAALALRNVFESGRDAKLLASGQEELELHVKAGNRASLRHAEEQLARLRAEGTLPLTQWLQDRMSRLPKGAKVICISAGASANSAKGREAVERAAKLAAVRGGRAFFWLAGEGEEASLSASGTGVRSGARSHWFGGSVAYMPVQAGYRELPFIERGNSDAAATIGS